jgi:hypothetical protein
MIHLDALCLQRSQAFHLLGIELVKVNDAPQVGTLGASVSHDVEHPGIIVHEDHSNLS